eukprot:NODE_1367_length_1206_cov_0.770758.p1 type:complete len:140 gc:universal NODE_1367_length_1206_cov_0.770758:108-527(+)
MKAKDSKIDFESISDEPTKLVLCEVFEKLMDKMQLIEKKQDEQMEKLKNMETKQYEQMEKLKNMETKQYEQMEKLKNMETKQYEQMEKLKNMEKIQAGLSAQVSALLSDNKIVLASIGRIEKQLGILSESSVRQSFEKK